MSNILVYELDKKIYINLTNRCTNECIFCLRQDKDDVCGQELWLDSEDFTSEDVIEQLKKFNLSSEVIFCGYGEPMLKFEVLRQVAKYIKETYPKIKIRVNTNGHANFIYKKNVVPELVGLVDEFSVSLNASNSEEYDELSQPKFENETVASIVDGYKGRRLDVDKCREIAESLGAKLRVREWIVNGYS